MPKRASRHHAMRFSRLAAVLSSYSGLLIHGLIAFSFCRHACCLRNHAGTRPGMASSVFRAGNRLPIVPLHFAGRDAILGIGHSLLDIGYCCQMPPPRLDFARALNYLARLPMRNQTSMLPLWNNEALCAVPRTFPATRLSAPGERALSLRASRTTVNPRACSHGWACRTCRGEDVPGHDPAARRGAARPTTNGYVSGTAAATRPLPLTNAAARPESPVPGRPLPTTAPPCGSAGLGVTPLTGSDCRWRSNGPTTRWRQPCGRTRCWRPSPVLTRTVSV